MPRDQILRDASRRLTEAAEAALHDYSMRLAAEGADTGEIRRKLEALAIISPVGTKTRCKKSR
jgi:hypothetical protein